MIPVRACAQNALKRAISACEQAGTGAKVMCHIGGVETRALMSQILDVLRPGDILTHCYSGFPNMAGDFTNIVQDGRLIPAAINAKQRGVIFDIVMAVGASTIRSRKPLSSKAACPTLFHPTFTYSPAIRRECPI